MLIINLTKAPYAKDTLNLKGSGLGLSVTYKIIEQHKGTIEVESKKGKETTFVINLPVPKVIKKQRKPVRKKKTKPDIHKKKYLKILVVDDEKAIINLMKSIFKKAGHKDIVVKKSGKEALSTLETFNPDVIFLDMLMPDIDGEQLLKEIRKMKIKAPVVFISGKIGLTRNSLIKKGVFDLIEKAFYIEDVFKVLNKVEKRK